MLNFDETDNIVSKNLDCLDPEIYEVRTDRRGQSNLYTVRVKKTSRLLGRYRIEKRPDGGVNYGAIQGDSSEWDLIWESMLNRTLQRADGTMTEAIEQDYQKRQDIYLKQIQEHKVKQLANPATVEAAQDGSAKPEKPYTETIEPWKSSRPNKRERDRIIWTMREDNATWNDIYDKLNKDPENRAAISTIKSNYARMKEAKEKIG